MRRCGRAEPSVSRSAGVGRTSHSGRLLVWHLFGRPEDVSRVYFFLFSSLEDFTDDQTSYSMSTQIASVRGLAIPFRLEGASCRPFPEREAW